MNTITPNEALEINHTPITRPYDITSPKELRWLASVISDMQGTRFSIVANDGGIEVWRHRNDLLGLKEQ